MEILSVLYGAQRELDFLTPFLQDSLWLRIDDTVYQNYAVMKLPTQEQERNRPGEEESVSVIDFNDPTVVGDSIELIEQDVVNLDREEFSARRVTVPFVDGCLIYYRTNSRLRTRTQVYEDYDSFTVLGPKAHSRLDGAVLHPYSMMTGLSGSIGEIVVERDYESVGILVPSNVIEKHLSVRGRTTDFAFPKGAHAWQPDVECAQKTFELGKRIVDAAVMTPEVFDRSHWARYGAQVEFIDSLLATIESCSEDKHIETDRKEKSYSQIVKTCEDFTLGLDGRRPYLSELCEVSHVSERTLQYAFRNIMGMSPFTYLIRLRLHRAHDELRKAKSESTSVTDVALNWGFWHFGEFSRAYKNCFGEVPSRTLGQSPDG